MNVLFIGRPGSGKGVQGKLLSEKLGYKQVISIDIISQEIESNSVLGESLNSIVSSGELVPDRIINMMIASHLNKLGFKDRPSGYIFDGYPRTVDQAKRSDRIMEILNSKIDIVIALEVDEFSLVERTLKMGDFSDREDDRHEDVILNRIRNHDKHTEPLKEYYKDRLHIVDGNGSIKETHKKIMDVIHMETNKNYDA